MEGFSIRPASEDDLVTVANIEKQVHRAPWTQEGFRSELEKPFAHFLVTTDDETDSRMAGYLVYWVIDRECRILNVAVDRPFRGMGVAIDLVRAAIRGAMGEGAVRAALEVRKSNDPAIQLYQKIGFTTIQVRKSFYSDGEDAYVMELSLEGAAADF